MQPQKPNKQIKIVNDTQNHLEDATNQKRTITIEKVKRAKFMVKYFFLQNHHIKIVVTRLLSTSHFYKLTV